MVKIFFFLLIILSLVLLITGCWDRVEIEERGFVIGIAIDAAKKGEAEEIQEKEAPDKPTGKQRFVVTYQFVVPGALSGGGGKSQRGGGSQEAYFNISSEGDTMDTINREFVTRTSRSPFLRHLQLIIISEEAAKSEFGFANVLDYFLRDEEMRRSMKVIVAKGEARSALEAKPPSEKLPVMYINSVAENTDKSTRMLSETRIGDLQGSLLRDESFIVQRIIGGMKEVKIAGSAVFQSKKSNLIGFLGEEETEGLNFIIGEVNRGVLEFQNENNLLVYEIANANRKIKAKASDKEHIEFTISIETKGSIEESSEPLDFSDPIVVSDLEHKVEQEIKRLTSDTIEKVHKEFKKDVLGLGAYLQQEHYDIWKLVKDDWDSGNNFFAKSQIDVEAKVSIQRTGIVNKTKK